jgi:RNA-directed DNA polymerase
MKPWKQDGAKGLDCSACYSTEQLQINRRRMMQENTRPIPITEEQVWSAYLEVRKHGKSAGVDQMTLQDYEADKSNQLYKVWNRMSSGSYFPPPVRRVEIAKSNGKKRKLGIPTISDRVAQTVIKNYLEPLLEPIFHEHSFGYRPHKNAHDAVHQATEQCRKKAWVVDLDIEGFFDNLDHGLTMLALQKHITEKWVLMFIERWLKAPVEHVEGNLEHPEKGSPQGGVISPLLANLYLHYAFDQWMRFYHEDVVFERYADDIIIHCTSKGEAEALLASVRERLLQCGLRLHPEKTKIVYCKNSNRRDSHEKVSFEFLGFRFKPRKARNRQTGQIFTDFGPDGVSGNTLRKMMATLRSKRLHRQVNVELVALSMQVSPHVRGWLQYFGKVRLRFLSPVMNSLNGQLIRWAVQRHKSMHGSAWQARQWLRAIYRDYPNLFEHWKYGFKP